jgi:hypothetical protein
MDVESAFAAGHFRRHARDVDGHVHRGGVTVGLLERHRTAQGFVACIGADDHSLGVATIGAVHCTHTHTQQQAKQRKKGEQRERERERERERAGGGQSRAESTHTHTHMYRQTTMQW